MASGSKTLQLIISVLIPLSIELITGQEIYFHDGVLNGKKMTTRKGRKIDAYIGIPYAIPPIGSRRFKNPEPIQLWRGILDAKTDANQCPQIAKDGSVVGNEDCLYLNVYTPELNENFTRLWPVMVYIHGGDFVRGNGSSTLYGPQYLLDKEIILVTLNYRLGVLGFLATGDAYAPGNFGLKDQVLALKWIKEYIIFFGGDPYEITIFGEGAGGASVGLLSVSDTSKGIFHRVISQSGSIACFWAFNSVVPYKMYATDLGKYLGCPTSNSRALVKCLRALDIQKLVNSNDIFNDKFYRFSTWGPTEEPAADGAFMTSFPVENVWTERSKSYPSIIGNVRDEGLMFTARLYSNDTLYKKYSKHLDAFVTYIAGLTLKDRPDFYGPIIENFYFNGTDSSDKKTFLRRMTDLISDAAFIHPADLSSSIKTNDSTINPTYFYSFEYRGTISETSSATDSNDDIGVTHTDDLIYLFPRRAKQLNGSAAVAVGGGGWANQLEYSESDESMIDTMVELWTSFARTGTPHLKSFPESNFWIPYSLNRDYLKIGDNSNASVSRHDHFNEKRLNFWYQQIVDELYTSFFLAFRGR